MSRSSKIIDQVLAAVDSPALPYRTFPGDLAASGGPTQSFGSAFPLLAAAIPEISAQPVRPASAGAEAALAHSELVAEPPVGVHSQLDKSPPVDLARTFGPSETRIAVTELFQTAEPATRSPRRSATALGAIFRMLRGQTEQAPQASKRGLDDLFRRG